ncbi:MAG: class D sortase [Gammaproteobacteria bacterium]|nr:class D sortase [Gammaproteobacteria bacterium]
MTFKVSTLRGVEGLSWLLGIALSGFFLSQLALNEAERVSAIKAFELASASGAPDQSLWSDERIEAFEVTRSLAPDRVEAVLFIPDLDLKVPVYADASDLVMNLGAGLIPGTAGPDEAGNIGIAGHRDGYFRVLKDIEIGDTLTLQTPRGERRYRVQETLIVDPIDVDVLDATDQSSVTLVTCYPFYFVGSAPQRFVVKAQLDI